MSGLTNEWIVDQLFDGEDGLTDEEQGFVEELVGPESPKYKWKPTDQASREKQAKELKEELERIGQGVPKDDPNT